MWGRSAGWFRGGPFRGATRRWSGSLIWRMISQPGIAGCGVVLVLGLGVAGGSYLMSPEPASQQAPPVLEAPTAPDPPGAAPAPSAPLPPDLGQRLRQMPPSLATPSPGTASGSGGSGGGPAAAEGARDRHPGERDGSDRRDPDGRHRDGHDPDDRDDDSHHEGPEPSRDQAPDAIDKAREQAGDRFCTQNGIPAEKCREYTTD
jgi:hypothetical protein